MSLLNHLAKLAYMNQGAGINSACFFEHVAAVIVHCVDTQKKVGCNFFTAGTFCDEFQNFKLPAGKDICFLQLCMSTVISKDAIAYLITVPPCSIH